MKKLDNRIVNRMNFMFFLFLLFSFFLIGKIFYLQNFEVDEKTRNSIEAVKNIEVESPRGNIYSDNGDLLVSTVIKYELRWDSKIPSKLVYNSNINSLTERLSDFFGQDQYYFRQYLDNARNKNNRYLLIGKNLSMTEVEKIAARTIGYEKIDKEGKYLRVGLEGAYTEYLSGKSGLRLMQKIADGQWKPMTPNFKREPVQGYDLHTTKDIEIQDIVHHE